MSPRLCSLQSRLRTNLVPGEIALSPREVGPIINPTTRHRAGGVIDIGFGRNDGGGGAWWNKVRYYSSSSSSSSRHALDHQSDMQIRWATLQQ